MTQPNDLSQVVREMRETVKRRDVRHGYVYTEVVTEWADRIESSTTPAAINPQGVDSRLMGGPAEARVAENLTQLDGDIALGRKRDGYLGLTSLVWTSTLERARDCIATLARQLAEAKELADRFHARAEAYRKDAEQAEPQLAQATARLAAVEGLPAKWEQGIGADHRRICASQLRAALQPKEPQT